MAKKICVSCGRELGIAAKKTAIADGVVCMDCQNRAGIQTFSGAESFTAAEVRELFKERAFLPEHFQETKSAEKYLHLDEEHGWIRVGKDIVSCENVVGYEFVEDKVTLLKSEKERVDASKVLTTSAMGFSFGRKNKRACSSMKLLIRLKDTYTDTLEIVFLQSEVRTKDILYRSMHSFAISCIDMLEEILHGDEPEAEGKKQTPSGPEADLAQALSGPEALQGERIASISPADEIRKFKELMDDGIITPEEFEAKKKQLLNL